MDGGDQVLMLFSALGVVLILAALNEVRLLTRAERELEEQQRNGAHPRGIAAAHRSRSNSARYPFHSAAQVWVPWPRVCSLAGSST